MSPGAGLLLTESAATCRHRSRKSAISRQLPGRVLQQHRESGGRNFIRSRRLERIKRKSSSVVSPKVTGPPALLNAVDHRRCLEFNALRAVNNRVEEDERYLDLLAVLSLAGDRRVRGRLAVVSVLANFPDTQVLVGYLWDSTRLRPARHHGGAASFKLSHVRYAN